MLILVRSIVSRLVCRFRNRAVVELENLIKNPKIRKPSMKAKQWIVI